MTKVSKVLVVISCLLILIGVVSKFAPYPIIIATQFINSISFLIAANTALLLAILLKK